MQHSFISSRHGPLKGICSVPGDKSVSHRSLMFASLAVGRTRVEGLLEGEDVLATARALRQLGVRVERKGDGIWEVFGSGTGGFSEPADVLDFGNAGTGVRLMAGILAGHDLTATLTGDASLCSRPMGRVLEPLVQTGLQYLARDGIRLPLTLKGSRQPLAIEYSSKQASAQVKSAILLCGLHAMGTTTIIEPMASRDHSERMLGAMGAVIESGPAKDGGWLVQLEGMPELNPVDIMVPGDPSSAAFLMAGAAATERSEITISKVSINPLRAGFLKCLQEMGVSVDISDMREMAGEPVADVTIKSAELNAIDVPAERVPSMVDEYPVLAVLAAFARGTTIMRGLGELRVKETDRLAVMADGLRASGVQVEIDGDDLLVEGPVKTWKAAEVHSMLDHRIAMSFLVLGGLADAPVTVHGCDAITTSFPNFVELMNGLGASIGKA